MGIALILAVVYAWIVTLIYHVFDLALFGTWYGFPLYVTLIVGFISLGWVAEYIEKNWKR